LPFQHVSAASSRFSDTPGTSSPVFPAEWAERFAWPMDDIFNERVQLALKVLASVYGQGKGGIAPSNDVRKVKSCLGTED
jgi:hypothetical protein